MWIIGAILIGVFIGLLLPVNIQPVFAKYLSVAFLAGLDSVLGAARAGMTGKYNFAVFSSGFITNALLAALLTWMGDRLGVDLYIAAVVVFGGRIFQNLAIIRRDFLIQIKPDFAADPGETAEQVK